MPVLGLCWAETGCQLGTAHSLKKKDWVLETIRRNFRKIKAQHSMKTVQTSTSKNYIHKHNHSNTTFIFLIQNKPGNKACAIEENFGPI